VLVRSQLTVAVVERTPEIPTRHRAMWGPLCADSFHLLGGRSLAHPVGAPDGVLNSQIQLWQHVAASEAEHQKHLRSPASYAFDLNEMLDEVVVVHRLDRIERKRAARDLR